MAQQSNIVENKKRIIESASSLSVKVRESFFVWLSDGHTKKYPPVTYLECIDKVSVYLTRRKISSVDLWELTNFGLFKSVYDKAINDNLFKATDKKTHTVFVQVGKDFLKFLKSKPAIHKVPSVDLEQPGQPGTRLTIKEAIIRVLDAEPHGITAEQIYNKIIANGLYSFGAKKPIDIVRGQIDRACVNSNYTIRASKDCFRFERNENGQKVYSLLTPTLTDNVAQPGISDEGEPAESEQEVFNTAVAKVDSQPITTHEFIIKDDSARFAQQTVRDAFRAWLTTHNPEWSSRTVMMHYSDAYYLYNNKRGITLEVALTADDGLQKAYDAIARFYTDNPTQTNNPSDSARGYLRSLRKLKEFFDEKYPELLSANSASISAPSVPDAVIDVLNKNYASGFRFDTTYINLLSSASGVEVDGRMQSALKRIMFRRDDGIYFLLDIVADSATREDIIDFADTYLQEYGCFEIPEFYKLYEDKVNPDCIRNADDFESFYEQIGKSGVRCVQAPYVGNRIARYSNGGVWSTFEEVAAKIVSVITEEYYGSCNEDDLHTKFCAFSTDLLGKIIKQCAADELIRVEINDSVCYQTFDALGLPDNFSEVLAEALERLSDIGLDPTQDVLHTTLSLKLGVNFRAEYNLPNWDTYRRLIAAFYKAEPRREWKSNIFGEVTN